MAITAITATVRGAMGADFCFFNKVLLGIKLVLLGFVVFHGSRLLAMRG
jgi:hypothetical protein